MSAAVRPASDCCLMILDDEGVFFSESRQELYVFNTAATFVWCCVEDGQPFADVAMAYARAFDVPREAADRTVADLLSRWHALGYVVDLEAPPSTPILFTTALGRLLSTRALRDEFTRSPRAVVQRMGVRAEDVDALLSLDPAAIERQVTMLQARQAAIRDTGEARSSSAVFLATVPPRRPLVEAAAEARLRDRRTAPIVHHYRLLGADFALRFSSPDQEAAIHPLLAHLERDDPAGAPIVFDIVEFAGGHLVLDDVLPVGHCARLDELAALVESRLRHIAIARYPYFLQIHAGVVSDGERCVLLPGPPGRGKTTLTAALTLSGFRYLSDELALLDSETLGVRPVPLSLGIKPGAVEVLARTWPAVRQLPAHLREDGQVVHYLAPPRAAVAAEASHPVGWLVFPDYAATAETAARPLARGAALRWLMSECLVLPESLDRGKVERLVRWMRGLDCVHLPMSSLPEAIEVVRRLVAGGPRSPMASRTSADGGESSRCGRPC